MMDGGQESLCCTDPQGNAENGRRRKGNTRKADRTKNADEAGPA
jgi:hypothetical protein